MPSVSLTIVDGQSACFECQVLADPHPNLAWFHEHRLLRESDEFVQEYDDGHCTLLIKEVYPEDAGKYTVAAKNAYGTATCAAHLTVREGNAIDRKRINYVSTISFIH